MSCCSQYQWDINESERLWVEKFGTDPSSLIGTNVGVKDQLQMMQQNMHQFVLTMKDDNRRLTVGTKTTNWIMSMTSLTSHTGKTCTTLHKWLWALGLMKHMSCQMPRCAVPWHLTPPAATAAVPQLLNFWLFLEGWIALWVKYI